MYGLFISAVAVTDNNDFEDGDLTSTTTSHKTDVYLAGIFY